MANLDPNNWNPSLQITATSLRDPGLSQKWDVIFIAYSTLCDLHPHAIQIRIMALGPRGLPLQQSSLFAIAIFMIASFWVKTRRNHRDCDKQYTKPLGISSMHGGHFNGKYWGFILSTQGESVQCAMASRELCLNIILPWKPFFQTDWK
ncbi:hypothetical protein BS47DRAFT_1431344 [Hydnum rufescens UP504]|uniref:Uncharacterized protein n=1 Tax=Hydnum rufescens UP504 TaxID=1448309 RepID=A0A9P6AHJ3_9AGAM|nr:hypothetical protein BS47DRAFT_1431344 [Hydnum rufescens UP504]